VGPGGWPCGCRPVQHAAGRLGVFKRQNVRKWTQNPIFLHVAMDSIFTAEFLGTLTSEESETLVKFHTAATQVRRPLVRKTCEDAGFVMTGKDLHMDPIFLGFEKWVAWAVNGNPPSTGLVVGDTWLDFSHVHRRQRYLYFVVDDDVDEDEDPIEGSVHVGGLRKDSFLSVCCTATARLDALTLCTGTGRSCHAEDFKSEAWLFYCGSEDADSVSGIPRARWPSSSAGGGKSRRCQRPHHFFLLADNWLWKVQLLARDSQCTVV
jgi:hypothetical protein